MMSNQQTLCMMVIDVLRHVSPGRIQSVMNLLNNDGCLGWRFTRSVPFETEEVIDAIDQLTAMKAIVVSRYTDQPPPHDTEQISTNDLSWHAQSEQLLFTVTEHGMHLWDEWDPPIEPDQKR